MPKFEQPKQITETQEQSEKAEEKEFSKEKSLELIKDIERLLPEDDKLLRRWFEVAKKAIGAEESAELKNKGAKIAAKELEMLGALLRIRVVKEKNKEAKIKLQQAIILFGLLIASYSTFSTEIVSTTRAVAAVETMAEKEDELSPEIREILNETATEWLQQELEAPESELTQELLSLIQKTEIKSLTWQEFSNAVAEKLSQIENKEERAELEKNLGRWLCQVIYKNIEYPSAKPLSKFRLRDVLQQEADNKYYANCLGSSQLYSNLGEDIGLNTGVAWEQTKGGEGHAVNILIYSDKEIEVKDLTAGGRCFSKRIRANLDQNPVYMDVDWNDQQVRYCENNNEITKSFKDINISSLNRNSVGAMLHSNLGGEYFDQKQYAKAESEFKKGKQIDPDYASNYTNLGAIYLQQNRLGDAEIEFKLAIQKDKKDSTPVRSLGHVYLKQNRLKDAVIEFENSVNINKFDLAAHIDLASTYGNLGNLSTGVEQKKYYKLALQEYKTISKWQSYANDPITQKTIQWLEQQLKK